MMGTSVIKELTELRRLNRCLRYSFLTYFGILHYQFTL